MPVKGIGSPVYVDMSNVKCFLTVAYSFESQQNATASNFNFNFLSEAVASTLCEKDEEATHHRLECLIRQCEECGIEKFELSEEEQSTDVLVKWKRYEYVTVQDKNGEEQRKISLVIKETPVHEMFKYFLDLLDKYTYHSFMAKWQKDQFDSLVANLPLNHVICGHDFSENYVCRSQDKIQSQYFDPNKVSIHVTTLYRHASLQTDGKESTGDNPSIVKEHLFTISDDNTQDYHFVHHVQSLIVRYLRELWTRSMNSQMAVQDSRNLSTPLETFPVVLQILDAKLTATFLKHSTPRKSKMGL